MIAEAIGGFFREAARTISPIHPRDPALARMFGMGRSTKAGVAVDEMKVLAMPAVWRAVNIISNGIMKVPFHVFREEEEGRSFDRGHPSWTCVRRKAHPEIKAPDLRQCLTGWALTWGNGCAYIHRPNWPEGPVELIPLLPDRTSVFRLYNGQVEEDVENGRGQLMYRTRIKGQDVPLLPENVLHIKGYGPNPFWGYDIVSLMKETLGGALAASEFGHRFFGQGANPAGFVEVPTSLKGDRLEFFRDELRAATSGLGEAHRIALLEEGAKFSQWTMEPEKAQFLETKQFDVRQLAMVFNIKVHKLIDTANSSYNSLEQANQEHKEDDLMPWICRWRDEMSEKLLTEEEKETESHSIDIDDEYLQWVPFSERASGVVELYNNGLVDKDEGRRKVNFGPSRSPRAKDFRKPANIDFEDDVQAIATIPNGQGGDTDDELEQKYLSEVVRRLHKIAMAKAGKGSRVFLTWLDGLEPWDGPESVQEQINQIYADRIKAFNSFADTAKTDAELLELVQEYCEANQ